MQPTAHTLIASTQDYFPMFILAAATLVALVSIVLRYNCEKMWNDTCRAALEKGQPIPANMDRWSRRRDRLAPGRPLRDIRTGLILIGVWVAFSLQSSNGHNAFNWNNGTVIPGVIGVALLINAGITALFSRNDRDSNPPPQP